MANFRERITSTHELLQNISEEESQHPFREGGWSKKEILGHLVDSALNNHQRFVRAALDGFYEGPFYRQEGWVAMHGYKLMTWPMLVEHWRCQNELLCEVVERIPEDRLNAPCRVGTDAPVTLRFLVDDYLDHLGHHVLQITGRAQ
jgi:hypothetical protein